MARGDGIHRTSARNARMKDADIGNAQAHNEREKSSYVNQDIVPERTPYNIHFKTPTAGYKEMFEQMRSDGVISTRGLKADAEKFGELIFDVNSAYFFNHGGYDFAKQFYADAYKVAIKIVGGEQYILSAVMHADERNRAMSDALKQDVYHYHLHVVYIPVVEKQILWSKRCKDESLRGTVKEIIQQVSMSKKWDSKPALDENGTPILSAKGKPVLKKSYHDMTFPTERLISLAAKTTCKDRWRQVINEADRLRDRPKYLCTLQQGISPAQMDEMQSENVILVVPRQYITSYPADRQDRIWTLSKFVSYVREVEGL